MAKQTKIEQDKNFRSIDPSRFAAITSPIPLLALFGGISEIMIGTLVSFVSPSYQLYLIAGAIVLPIAWLITIFLLVAKYHAHLYAPGDFSQPEHFLATLSSSARASVSTGTLGKPLDFEPFKLSEHASQSDDEEIRHSRIETIITRLDVPELLALHAWHNENDSHSIALQALTLAIAKGRGASKNYSFASASMRKLGRLVEAKGIALLALQLDRDNVDAKYNLALICKMLGSTEEAKLFARDVALNGGEYHRKRIHEEFSDPV